MPGDQAPPPDPESMPFEAALEELEAIIERIESGAIGLEASLAERRRGEALIARCRAILDTADQELRQIGPDERAADAGEEGSGAT